MLPEQPIMEPHHPLYTSSKSGARPRRKTMENEYLVRYPLPVPRPCTHLITRNTVHSQLSPPLLQMYLISNRNAYPNPHVSATKLFSQTPEPLAWEKDNSCGVANPQLRILRAHRYSA